MKGEGVRVAIRVVLMMMRVRLQGEGKVRGVMVIKQDIRQYFGAIYEMAPITM